MKKLTIRAVAESATTAMNGLALAKIRAGERVYNLSAGEPMVPTPKKVTAAVAAALKAGKTHYPPTSGIPELRSAAASWMSASFNARYIPEETLVVPGGKFGIFIILQALLAPGDEVLIPAPYWVSYPSMVLLFGGVPKFIAAAPERGWKITASDIRAHASRRTKILILNSGCNPTGALYSRRELAALLSAAKAKGLFVISDEVYGGLVYEGSYASAASLPAYRANLAVIASASKSFAMTGFRVGFVFLKNTELMRALANLVSQSTTGVATPSQYAALAALKDAAQVTAGVRAAMRERRAAFARAFEKEFGVPLPLPPSGLYAFVRLADLGWPGSDSKTFCLQALAEANVATVPGAAFGRDGYVRFSFGAPAPVLAAGVRALARWIRKERKRSELAR